MLNPIPEDELRMNRFFQIGYDTHPGGFRVLQFVAHTEGKILKQLCFCASFIEGTNRYICGYKYKKNLTKQDKAQLQEIEKRFAEVVQKHGYFKLGKSLWENRTHKPHDQRKLRKVNGAKMDEISYQADDYVIVNSSSTVTIFYFKGANVIGVEVAAHGRAEYYASC